MSHDAAKRRLGAYTDRDLKADAKDLHIAELQAQLEDARQAIQDQLHRGKPRRAQVSFETGSFASDLWVIVFVLIGGLIVSYGIAW